MRPFHPFLASLLLGFVFGTASAAEPPIGHWQMACNGWGLNLEITRVDPSTGEIDGTIEHPTTRRRERLLGFWDAQRQYISFYRIPESDFGDHRFGMTSSGYLVRGVGPEEAAFLLVGTAQVYTAGAGGSAQRHEFGWYARFLRDHRGESTR